jgi:signal transduction histidine kinase
MSGSTPEGLNGDGATEQLVSSEGLSLSVHPSVVFKLGQDLIKDNLQALTELIKNAYDAGSPSVDVSIDTKSWFDGPTGRKLEEAELKDPQLAPLRGRILIADRGSGMTFDQIVGGWLVISASEKRALKADLSKLDGKRTPLGDKGLGRLGAQRLGDVLRLTTQAGASAKRYGLTISWPDFESARSLSAVKLNLDELPHADTGTTLEIRGLRDVEDWEKDALGEVERRISIMLSPYQVNPDFSIRILVNERLIDLKSRTDAIRNKAAVSYRISYADQTLTVRASASTLYIQPLQGATDIAVFERLVGEDNGAAFMTWLLEKDSANCAALGLGHGDTERFAFAESRIDLSLEPKFERGPALDDGTSPLIDPGPFTAEVDQVILRQNPTDIFNSLADYREFVRAIRGVRIYRDGFGVPVEDDWLELAAQWSSAQSYYTIRPENVIGHVDLSARWNAQLEEVTSREGFRDTPAYRNFVHIIGAWLKYSEQFQGALGRGYVAYKKAHLAEVAEAEPTSSPTALVKRVKTQMATVEATAQAVRDASAAVARVGRLADRLSDRRDELANELFVDARTTAVYDTAIAEITAITATARVELDSALSRITSFDAASAALDLLLENVAALEDQVASVWESVSLGLSAESLSHEASQVVDRLRARGTQAAARMKHLEIKDKSLLEFVEEVRGTAASLAKQVARLDPSIRAARDRKQQTSIGDFVLGQSEYFRERWEKRHISLVVDVVDDFEVNMNVGKLSQVLDNLLLNSEYWLERRREDGATAESAVLIDVDSPFVYVRDTGYGVNPSVEETLFDPFVTTKPATRGRGLGLYISRQLLDSEQIDLDLLQERNELGRRYIFRLDFSRHLTSERPR